jgi:hypothetical protein
VIPEHSENAKGLTRGPQGLLWRGAPVAEMLAVPLPVAAVLLGISRATLYRQVGLGYLRKTPQNTISRRELDRYVNQTVNLPTK